MKSHTKTFLLLHWIRDDKRLEICKNQKSKSSMLYFQQSEWIL